jgi:hypothetical protein
MILKLNLEQTANTYSLGVIHCRTFSTTGNVQ